MYKKGDDECKMLSLNRISTENAGKNMKKSFRI